MKQGMSCLFWALVALALWAVCGGGAWLAGGIG